MWDTKFEDLEMSPEVNQEVVGFIWFLPTLDFDVDVVCPLLGTTFERWKLDPFWAKPQHLQGHDTKNLVDLVERASKMVELCAKRIRKSLANW